MWSEASPPDGYDDGDGLLSGNADQDVEEGVVGEEAYAVGARGEGLYLSELGLEVLNFVAVLGEGGVGVIMPRAPELDTVAASSALETQGMPAWIMGDWMLRDLVSRVAFIAPLW